MLPDPLQSLAAVLAVGAPAAALLLLGALLLFFTPSERWVSRITRSALLLSLIASAFAAHEVLLGPRDARVLPLGLWFEVDGYGFDLRLLVDRLSASMMLLTGAITCLIGRFSVTYMHRERGFARFFLLLLLFATGMMLLVMAGSIDLLFAGWELVGLSSVLLIAFFQERAGPVRSGLRAFVTYRACDFGLLLGATLLHHYAHTADFDLAFGPGGWPLQTAHLSHGAATLVSLSLLLAAMGKSAQVPFTGWLPRAMEGPTPSSALFYGALSVHAGCYLLLRAAPLLERSPEASAVVLGIGALTALYASTVGRGQPDAKNSLAYATATQVGVIFAEIGLGLYTLAVAHLIGHACVRTLQLLRAPSALHDTHQVRAAAGVAPFRVGGHYERLLPARARAALYRLALFGFHLDGLLARFVVRPVLTLAERIDRIERRWFSALNGFAEPPYPREAEAPTATPIPAQNEQPR
jgi:NADH-quinone oxidoreductase subunit L